MQGFWMAVLAFLLGALWMATLGRVEQAAAAPSIKPSATEVSVCADKSTGILRLSGACKRAEQRVLFAAPSSAPAMSMQTVKVLQFGTDGWTCRNWSSDYTMLLNANSSLQADRWANLGMKIDKSCTRLVEKSVTYFGP
jgi:hypothetical protein